MKVLFLGPRDSTIFKYLKTMDNVRLTTKPITEHNVWNGKYRDVEWIVSHRYTHRVPNQVLNKFQSKNLNVHCGLFAHARGVHPVFFSALLDLTIGVTIHEMVDQFDAGPVYAWGALAVYYMPQHTFRSLWNRVNEFATDLFKLNWEAIRSGEVAPTAAPLMGNYFSKKDFEYLKHVLEGKGWDTLIVDARARLTPYTLKQLMKAVNNHLSKHSELIDTINDERRRLHDRMVELEERERECEAKEEELQRRKEELDEACDNRE